MVSTYTHALDLEPSLVERRTYTSRRRRHLLDTTFLLSLMLALVVLVRANQVVPQFPGGLGRPALVLGAALAAGWLLAKFHPRLAVRGPQPLRWAGAVYLGAIALAYAAGHLRGLTSLEGGGADRAMLAAMIFIGIALVCADGVPNRSRLDDLLRTLVWLGAGMALVGIAQFVTGFNFVDFIQLPGLVNYDGTDGAVAFRERGDDLFQVASTATHYIEFSAVMAMILPIGIHTARFNRSRPARQWAFLATFAMATALPITLSRTGILAAFAGLVLLGITWSWRVRFNIAVLSTVLFAGLLLVRPGLLGTVRSLFANMGSDPSIEGRTDDYDAAAAYFAERPWFGRGPGTFIPHLYDWIDNEWLMHVITTGVIGTGALAAWHITTMALAAVAYRRARREVDRHLCACLVVIQIMAVMMSGTYDTMSFTTHTTVLAVLTGAAGAMWRFTHPARQIRTAASLPVGPR